MRFVLPLCLCAVLGWSGASDANPPKKTAPLPEPAKKPIDFVRDIKPLFDARCVRCHGPKKSEGGLRLDRQASALAGGNSGPAFVAGKSAHSILVKFVAGADEDTVMPPSGARLTGEQVSILRAWIDQGAKWADGSDKVEASKSAGSEHWAFRPVTRPKFPTVKNAAWVRNPIDLFVLARLEKDNLQPSPEARRVTLMRRLHLDLVGLPPTPAEVDAFLADTRADAYERLVERLLASPHYGERWGRHWLDAARYADSDGYNFDGPRPVWKYRDWVIGAFNRDMPFDQFVVEQIAGDLLPNATVEQKTATGFHRNTLYNAEGGNDPEEFRVERVSDRVGTTGTVFLGLTVGCAECHSHKYDPITQREFYEMFAFFNDAEEVELELPTPAEQKSRAAYEARLRKVEADLVAHDKAFTPNRVRQVTRIALVPTGASPLGRLMNLHLATDPVRPKLIQEIAKVKKQPVTVTRTLAMASTAPGKQRSTKIHIRGDFRRAGAVVTPNVPRALPPLTLAGKSATRLDLAKWLAAKDNPLTARVTVNRLWQPYFGKGLVETENDFGTQGSPPSHPELLDWLASEFSANAWSMKSVHRLIVNSATYRQSSRDRADLANIDPRNRLLGRQVRLRLEAEVVRDAMLASAGILSDKIGGPSVFPYQPAGIMETRRSPIRWVMSSGQDGHRRTMYTHFWRTSPHPFLMAFDAPKSDSACTRRQPSNTSIQALMLLNDPMFVEAARALATRVLKEGPSDPAGRLRHAFRLCVAREPSPSEQRILGELLEQQRTEFRTDAAAARKLAGPTTGIDVAECAAWAAVARVLFNLDEAIVRE